MLDTAAVQRYLRLVHQGYDVYSIPSRLEQLHRQLTLNSGIMTEKMERQYNCLHKQMYNIRRKAEARCQRVTNGAVPWSPQIQNFWDRQSLWKLLLKGRKQCRVSSRKIRRLMKKTKLPDAWKKTTVELETALRNDRKEYLHAKKNHAVSWRKEFLTVQVKKSKKKQWTSRKARDRFLRLRRMKQREEARRRRRAQSKGSTGGLQAIQVEEQLPTGQVDLRTLTDRRQVEQGCMQENRTRYDQTRSPYTTPPMDKPLYSMFMGADAEMNSHALLEGRLPLPDEIDSYTQSFLEQCRFHQGHSMIPMEVSPADHTYFWSCNPENKGSEPHGLHNGHFKAGIYSPMVAQCDALFRHIPLTTGFVPDNWRHLMNFAIEKKPGDLRLTKMRTIQLMNSESQANYKKLGRLAMAYGEEHHLLADGQCGSRKHHQAINLALSKRLVWDLLILQRRSADWISNDATSCFDRVVHWVAVLAMMRLAIAWNALRMMFDTLAMSTHQVRTGFGDSEESFQPHTWLKRVWKELEDLDIYVALDTPVLPLRCEGDALLIEVFMELEVDQDALKWLNWCRMFLQFCTVSDIMTADGCSIRESMWHGERDYAHRSSYQWPCTVRPNRNHWKVWQEHLTRALLVSDGPQRLLRHPLGPWIDPLDNWSWLWSSTHGLFHRQGHGWQHYRHRRSSTRSIQWDYPRSTQLSGCKGPHNEHTDNGVSFLPAPFWTQPLPADLCRATVHITSSLGTLALTGIGTAPLQPHHNSQPSLLAASARVTEYVGWTPEEIEIDGYESLLAAAILEDRLCAISDGSYKLGLGTAAVQLLPHKGGTERIIVRCQTPGLTDDQSAYRIAPQQAQFDLVSFIREALARSRALWEPSHVFGHLDKATSFLCLSWWSKRNVEVDAWAVAYCHQLKASHRLIAPNARFFTELAALYTGDVKQSRLNPEQVQELVALPALRKRLHERQTSLDHKACRGYVWCREVQSPVGCRRLSCMSLRRRVGGPPSRSLMYGALSECGMGALDGVVGPMVGHPSH
ncbi:unnamed protein product [Cylindrotheca closterium]|uniref:Uncharacterized protein n=1 Tax=Cylindrotheca closterium TaxID=2856 RepID=A0AAD2FV58_9STRA|nr:unnamed protein product [Cylindrotheca closterium]